LGAGLTISGWIQINDTDQKDHPLVLMRLIENDGEINFPETFKTLFTISYNNTNNLSPEIKFNIADSTTTF
jgi:hypothetical protein